MANKMSVVGKVKQPGKPLRKLTFHGGSPDAVKREPPKGRKRTMKRK